MKSKVLKLLAAGVMAVALVASFGAFTTFAETVKASGILNGVQAWKYYADAKKTQEITEEEWNADPTPYFDDVTENACKWTLYNSGRLDITLNSGYKSGTIADFSKVTDVPWYSNRASVTSVNVAEGVKTIGKWTFGSLENCKSATLPSTIDTIPESCFSGSGLTSFTFPQNVSKINLYAFKDCASLSTVTFDNNLTEIGTNAFDNAGLTTLDFTSGITTIGNNAFIRCSNLKSVKIPNIDNFGVSVFSGCTALENVEFDEGVTDIKDTTFSYCTALKSITLPETLTAIGNGSFNSAGLEYIVFPKSLTSIGAMAFGSTNIKSVTIPNIDNFGTSVFSGCTALENVEFDEGVTDIKDSTFSGCSSLKSITLPEKLTTIGNGSFNSTGLEYIVFPKSLTSIGALAFGSTNIKSVTIPNIDNFGTSVFSGCTALENVEFDEGVTDIKDSTFSGCSSLKSITLPEKLTTIGNGSFNSTGLEYIVFPKSLTSIGALAFGSTNLEAVYFQSGIFTLTAGTFSSKKDKIGFYVDRNNGEIQGAIHKYVGYDENDTANERFVIVFLGDTDGDGNLNNDDIHHALRYITTAEGDEIVDKYAIDMNIDGKRDMVDVIALYNYI